jgi:hypothetical protein
MSHWHPVDGLMAVFGWQQPDGKQGWKGANGRGLWEEKTKLSCIL